ncbi:nitronate monooxygenase [Rickettsiales bacterium]|nr:nitronate monooxygenase [Rickettsiales bacterium]MDB2550601.1 nitronate monooxygenase [Rickettsiales bacterium]
MLNKIKSHIISGKECLPIIEGGKGIGVTNGITAGNFAKSGAVGTFSGVNADYYDENGNLVPVIYRGKTRKERHQELIDYGINGGVAQARIANDISAGNGRIHINVLWEMGGAEEILHGILKKAGNLIHGVTCGAGMPYRLAEIAAQYNVHYYPIVSSMRAFRALWKRSYKNVSQLLGGIVYECPWKAGGHNGLSNSEDPNIPQDSYPRIAEIRKFMNSVGLDNVPIVVAGGVWNISEYENYLDNPEIGPVIFQFGTRPILTKEYPVSDSWKKKFLSLKDGDVYLNRFSPTGFYSSAVENDFIRDLKNIENRQIEFKSKEEGDFSQTLEFGPRKRLIYVKQDDKSKAQEWQNQGFDELMKTPDNTVIFVTKPKSEQIIQDQIDCMGCLSQCRFSNWSQDPDSDYSNGKKADPRSFCIQKTLQDVRIGKDIENQLMFAGHNAYRFATDSFYDNGNIPTISQLVDRIMTGK